MNMMMRAERYDGGNLLLVKDVRYRQVRLSLCVYLTFFVVRRFVTMTPPSLLENNADETRRVS